MGGGHALQVKGLLKTSTVLRVLVPEATSTGGHRGWGRQGRGQGITFRASLGGLEASVQHQLKGKRHVVDLPRKQEQGSGSAAAPRPARCLLLPF